MSEPGPSSRQRPRLNKGATALLTHYATTINSYPQSLEKQNILAKIHAIPGNEWYTIEKLNSWFARHRHPTSARRQSGGPALVDEESILFPKLTPVHLQNLRILYRKRTDPAENIITFWAERIKADRHEVVAWIQYQQEKAKENDFRQPTPDSPDIPLRQLAAADPDGSEGCASPIAHTFSHPHLPTPAKSESPSMSPHVRIPSLPPIAVKIEHHRQCVSPPISAHLPITTSHQFHVGAQLSRDSSQSFAATVRESLRHNFDPTESPPKTPDDFSAKFVTFEKMIDAFMDKHTSGQLARLGWDASICCAGS